MADQELVKLIWAIHQSFEITHNEQDRVQCTELVDYLKHRCNYPRIHFALLAQGFKVVESNGKLFYSGLIVKNLPELIVNDLQW